MIVALSILLICWGMVAFLHKKKVAFKKIVLFALLLGLVSGAITHLVFKNSPSTINSLVDFFTQIATLYIHLLKMMVFPLVSLSLMSAIIKVSNKAYFGRIFFLIFASLIITVTLSSLVALATASFTHLTPSAFKNISSSVDLSHKLPSHNLWDLLISLIPNNPFESLSGGGSNPLLSLVFISIVVAIAALQLKESSPKQFEFFKNLVYTLESIVFMIIKAVIKLTPYAIIPLISKVFAGSTFHVMKDFLTFFTTAYLAIGAMFIVHLFILLLLGLNPLLYLKKGAHGLLFAFSTANSTAALPLSIEILEERFGITKDISRLAPTLALTIGQNGCAGIYPTLLAFLTAPLVGIDPFTFHFITQLLLMIIIGSFGVAAVGGGGTLAALLVLPLMGLPIHLVGIFMAIEPLIDMGRTALNVSGGWVAGLFSARLSKEINLETYRTP